LSEVLDETEMMTEELAVGLTNARKNIRKPANPSKIKTPIKII
jgi:hypothetical protein